MEATVSILARIPNGEGYRLATLEKKRGSFIKAADALCYYLRYTDATTRKRITVPAGEDFNATVVKALNVGNNQSAILNGQEPAAPQVETGVRDKEAAHVDWDDIGDGRRHDARSCPPLPLPLRRSTSWRCR
jgi:hypothetical protein